MSPDPSHRHAQPGPSVDPGSGSFPGPAPDVGTASRPGADADGAWHRVHPLTPFVRSWLLVVALAWGFGNVFLDDLVTAVLNGDPIEMDVGGAVQLAGAGLAIAILCGVLGLLIGLGLLSWWFIRYQITDEHVRLRTGWLFRTHRQARLDRVQGIDIERKFVPRILGLASLKFDVADGGSSVLELSYLRRDHARQLRQQLLVAAHHASDAPVPHDAPTAYGASAADSDSAAHTGPAASYAPAVHGAPVDPRHAGPVRVAPWDRSAASDVVPAAGTDATGRDHALLGDTARGTGARGGRDAVDVRAARKYGLLGEQDELRRVFTVPTSRVLLSLVCSPPAVILGLMAVAAVIAAIWNAQVLRVMIPSFVPLLLAVVSTVYSRLEKSWGFTLSVVPSGVRTRSGLFNERSSTIPTGRVQALEVGKPLMWRGFDGHHVRVITAGKGGSEGTEGLGSVVLPVGTLENVHEILDLVLPLEHTPTELVDQGLTGIGDAQDFTTSPRRARWLDPFTWRRTGFALNSSALVLRWGRLARHTSVIPHHKTQSVAVTQGPVDRRLRLSGFAVHVTPGSVTTAVHHLDSEQARELQERHADLARAARDRVNGRGREQRATALASAPGPRSS
ncbi:PH domain-containing protein [Kocuria indica]|uniref:PH domain-containing protein n=1 Tax=Kocuria marina subsp. indica TaxID=1049583 RepID=A0A6N9QXK8_9MICC|nr:MULTISPECIES: PH domain-containing protein [Kocuria]MCT1616480.1 PH domain-containing protein [Kocuria marina]NDO77982.1 PH domain-containing protein [Kocuria indica]